MRKWHKVTVATLAGVVLCGMWCVTAPADEQPYQAVTTADPEIPVDQLKLLLKPLIQDELVVEADAWRDLLKDKVSQVSMAELEAKKKKEEMQQAAEKAEAAAEQARAAADPQAAEKAAPPPDEAEQAARQEVDAKAEVRTSLLEGVTKLQAERTALIDRLNAVLDELELKGGEVKSYQQYVSAVSGLTVDVSDAGAAWTTIVGWLKSEQGGIRWGKNIGKFVLILIGFWILAAVLAKAAEKALSVVKNLSILLKQFLIKSVRRTTLIVGVIIALTALEIKTGPILAVIGAAGFVVAFALQDTLGNLASGIMIMVQRPFDVGDVINAAGISGTVQSVSLVSTYIKTFDNQVLVVPNNSIWHGVITVVTGSDTRRVDMVFGIGYEDDIARAQSILEKIVQAHDKVLDKPEPTIKVHELADSSVNFICRPWVNTSDYWAVYWDVTRQVKEEFDRQGVSIPFPQRDIHVHQVAPTAGEPLTPSATT